MQINFVLIKWIKLVCSSCILCRAIVHFNDFNEYRLQTQGKCNYGQWKHDESAVAM